MEERPNHIARLRLPIYARIGCRWVQVQLYRTAKPLQKRFKYDPHRQLEWVTNDTLQPQHFAYEELEVGKRSLGDEIIPTTESFVKFSPMDISDSKHPRLLRTSGEKEKHRNP